MKQQLTPEERAFKKLRYHAEREEKKREGTLKSPSHNKKKRPHGRPR